jgi:hypothetical protein
MIEEVLEERLRIVMHQVLMVLHDNGIKEVSAGALMRLFGVPSQSAEKWDDTIFELSDSIEDLQALNDLPTSSKQLH